MPNKTLIKHLLHVKNTVINSMKLITAVDDEEQVVINARPTKGHRCLCPICMKRAPYYDSLEPRRWRSLDFGYTKVFIEAPVIRVDCPEHGVLTAWVPWARHHSMFTRDFENTVVWMSLYLIWVHDKHGKEVLKQFFELLSEEQRASIECVTADGARWISETMDEYIPQADRCLDFYHLVEWAQDALDDVRTEAWRRVRKKTKNKNGRPRKGEEPDKTADKIKHTRYALGKAPENLTANQAAQLEFIANTDRRLYKAYKLKEYLRTLIHLPLDELEAALKDWLWKASHSQIKPIYELQKKIRRHYDAILNTVRYHLSNARIEAMNNKIKLTVRMAYGFRNIQNMIDMIFLRCSDISVDLPYRLLESAHTS